jgi:hypothetical protein
VPVFDDPKVARNDDPVPLLAAGRQPLNIRDIRWEPVTKVNNRMTLSRGESVEGLGDRWGKVVIEEESHAARASDASYCTASLTPSAATLYQRATRATERSTLTARATAVGTPASATIAHGPPAHDAIANQLEAAEVGRDGLAEDDLAPDDIEQGRI